MNKEITNPILLKFKEGTSAEREEFLNTICQTHTETLCFFLMKYIGNRCGIKRLKAIKEILDNDKL